MTRIAIVEDDAKQARALADFAVRYAQERDVELRSFVYSNGVEFLQNCRTEFDAVFMDIAMPHMDGMTCAGRLRAKDENVCIIFVTNMAQYAIKGYEVNALAFLLKPVSYAEFSLKLDRVRRDIRKRGAATYAVSQPDGVRVLDVRNISYVEVYNHKLVFHTAGGELETYGKLSTVEADARFSRFVKISKSHLVNCAYITAIGEDTLTVDGVPLPLTRRRRKDCLEKMAGVMGGLA